MTLDKDFGMGILSLKKLQFCKAVGDMCSTRESWLLGVPPRVLCSMSWWLEPPFTLKPQGTQINEGQLRTRFLILQTPGTTANSSPTWMVGAVVRDVVSAVRNMQEAALR